MSSPKTSRRSSSSSGKEKKEEKEKKEKRHKSPVKKLHERHNASPVKTFDAGAMEAEALSPKKSPKKGMKVPSPTKLKNHFRRSSSKGDKLASSLSSSMDPGDDPYAIRTSSTSGAGGGMGGSASLRNSAGYHGGDVLSFSNDGGAGTGGPGTGIGGPGTGGTGGPGDLASEPNEHCFQNRLPEYREGKDLKEDDPESSFAMIPGGMGAQAMNTMAEWRNRFYEQIEADVRELEQGIQPMNTSDYTVYAGAGGVALMFLRLAELPRYQANGQSKRWLQKANDWLGNSLSYLRRKSMYNITFFEGDAGPWAIAAALHARLGDREKAATYVRDMQYLQDSFKNDSRMVDEHLNGRAGYLYALSFVRHHLGAKAVNGEVMEKLCSILLRSGEEGKRAHAEQAGGRGGGGGGDALESPLLYSWQGKTFYGACHGMAGIVMSLLQVKEFMRDDEVKSTLKQVLRFLCARRLPSGGNMPSTAGSRADRLVQWCHGAPGLCLVMCKAFEVYGEDEWLQAAVQFGEVTWRRGLLRKGLSLCHGIAGNAYALLAVFRVTEDKKWLHRAYKFGEFSLDRARISRKCRAPDRPFSLMEGLAGTIYWYADLIDYGNAGFPGFELPRLED